MSPIQRLLHRPFFIKLFNWEYWSFNALYMPIMVVWLWLSIRARSFFFFSAANPTIYNGGFLMESKWAIYKILPEAWYPKTIFVKAGTPGTEIASLLNRLDFQYPLIAKPDIGGKGRGVRKINAPEELDAYALDSKLDFLVQEFVNLHQEVGIFYYRYPGSEKGVISGIVTKEFLTVTGDGKSTIRELCSNEKRFLLQLPQLEKLYGEKLNDILSTGTVKELVPYGNHARGAKFIDDSYRIDEKLTGTIDTICQQIDGFYYGRLDVRFKSWDDLREGRNFSIIELNGAGSEPTHIYDPRHSLFFAWKEIIRHWIILWKISRLNHKKGIPYLTTKEGWKMLKDNKAFDKTLAEQDV
jgi:hypothetical protein